MELVLGDKQAVFDVAHCVALLEAVRDKCDETQRTLAGIHLSEAIALLKGELG